MAPPLISLKDVHLTFGGTPLIEGAELNVAENERIALVGRNGSGKSTLLKIAAGLVDADDGERFVHPSARVCYLPQESDFDGFETTLDYAQGLLGPADDPYQASYLLEQLGLTGEEHPGHLSGGEARRASLARVLAANPDVLLLDEPTNHLDLPAIEWLENYLSAMASAIVVISHDRRFLQTLSRATIWLDRGRTRRLESGFSEFEEWRDRILEEEQSDQHKLERKIVREDQWMHGGVTARRKRNVRRVKELGALRQQFREHRKSTGNVTLDVSTAGQSGRLVVDAKNISKRFADRTIIQDLSLRVMRGDRLGLVGPNGAGKTTLIKLLIGEMAPDSGQIRLGTNLERVSLDQKRDELAPTVTLQDALTGGRGDQVIINDKPRHVAGYMKDFLFLPEQRLTPIGALSGGERARLMLARALAKPSNFLVLDEPTNDFDIETLDLLQELLAEYPGTVILVSHDRDFLDRVVTSVLAPNGDGTWTEYAGGYSDMLAQRLGKDLGDAADFKNKTTKKKPTASSEAKPTGAQSSSGKLTYRDKHALETLPKDIARLEKEIGALNATLEDPELYSRDRELFEKTTERLAAAQDELDQAETSWLEIEERRAQLEQNSQ